MQLKLKVQTSGEPLNFFTHGNILECVSDTTLNDGSAYMKTELGNVIQLTGLEVGQIFSADDKDLFIHAQLELITD